jgi:peptidoglycan/xylan/chitin deacetylase (PgdA/CDA1 family)
VPLLLLKIALTKDTMDDVTTNFYRFAGRAIWCTNLSAGTYTWSATIFDYAGNSVTSTVSFYATGQPNPDAPAISDLNLTDDVTLMPDTGQIWLQGNVTGDGATVYASVNGGGAIRMNQRDGLFGSLLPLETGTNVVVIMAGDGAGANVSSRVLLIVRSDKFQAAVSSPTLGAFANGASLTASGTVSDKFAVGTDGEMGLSSITINGVEAMLGPVDSSGNRTWSTVDPINLLNGHANTNALSVNAQLCWTNGTTTICRTMPLGLLEGYEIVLLSNHVGSAELQVWRIDSDLVVVGAQGSKNLYQFTLNVPTGSARGFASSIYAPTQQIVSSLDASEVDGWYEYKPDSGAHAAEDSSYPGILTCDPFAWDWEGEQPQPMDASGDFLRGLSVGSGVYSNATFPGIYQLNDSRTDGTMTFRAPLHYEKGKPVIFTLEGVWYSTWGLLSNDLSRVRLKWNGEWHEPVAWTFDVPSLRGSVSYLLSVDGGSNYTLSAESFEWPATNVTWNSCGWCTGGIDTHILTFTNFYNHPLVMLDLDNRSVTVASGGPTRFPSSNLSNAGIRDTELRINANFDQGNGGGKVEDFRGNPSTLTYPNDPDLVKGTLKLSDFTGEGEWRLTFPPNVRVWAYRNDGWQKIDSGNGYTATAPITVPLRVEGMLGSSAKNDVKIVASWSGTALTDTASVTVVETKFMLTFDDGPYSENDRTTNILDALETNYVDGAHVKAAFFLVGTNVPAGFPRPGCQDPAKEGAYANPLLVRQVEDKQHFVGNHTLAHADLHGESFDVITNQIRQCHAILASILGHAPTRIFRPPMLREPDALEVAAASAGSFQIIWGATFMDWCPLMTPDVEALEYRIDKQYLNLWNEKAKPKSHNKPAILILHDSSDVTANHLSELMAYLRNRGYVLVHFDPDHAAVYSYDKRDNYKIPGYGWGPSNGD